MESVWNSSRTVLTEENGSTQRKICNQFHFFFPTKLTRGLAWDRSLWLLVKDQRRPSRVV